MAIHYYYLCKLIIHPLTNYLIETALCLFIVHIAIIEHAMHRQELMSPKVAVHWASRRLQMIGLQYS